MTPSREDDPDATLAGHQTAPVRNDASPTQADVTIAAERARTDDPTAATCTPPATTDAPSQNLFPGYEIVREIHRGGQGVVYQALQLSTRRHVAIKVLKEGPFAGPGDRVRFEREVRVLGQLSHPNIIAIHDSGVASGLHYFVMDYVSGLPLDHFVDDLRRRAGGATPLREIARLFERIGRALHVAHARGIVHRDLKPGNIRVGDDGEPRVLDFGLAKFAGGGDASRMTLTGQFVGSLPWGAPEQAEGRPDRIDARTDVYALGVMLYQMLVGRFPYEITGGMHEVLERILHAEPTRPRDLDRRIDDELETIALKCLAKERERRYAHAGELADDLRHYLTGEPISAKRASSWYVLRKRLPRYKLAAALALAGLIAVVSIGVAGRQRARMREQAARLAAQIEADRARLMEQCEDAILLMDVDQMDRLLARPEAAGLGAARLHMYRGWWAFARLELDRAMAEANQALTLAPDLADAYYLRAGLHSFNEDYASALADYATARGLATGTVLQQTFDGMLLLSVGQLDAGLEAMDRLVERRQSAGLGLWMRGFGRWMVLMRYPPNDRSGRWDLAVLALDDINAAARLYPHTPFVFDVRADLARRMIAMAPAAASPTASLENIHQESCDRLTQLGADGVALCALASLAWVRRDFDECERRAAAALDRLSQPTAVKGIHHDSARKDALDLLLLVAFIRGPSAACERMDALTTSPSPTAPRRTPAFVRAACAPRESLLGDRDPLGDPSETDRTVALDLWLGAVVRGDAELANAIARRCSVSTVSRLAGTWSAVLLGFMQGRETAERLRAAAGGHATRARLARLLTAVTRASGDDCRSTLRELVDEALFDRTHYYAVALLARAERDEGFLNRPPLVHDRRIDPQARESP